MVLLLASVDTVKLSIARKIIAMGIFLSSASTTAWAQSTQPVQVTGAWARAMLAGQQASAVYMRISAKTATRLVDVSSPMVGVAEVHDMKMEGDVMKMRLIENLEIPAGKTVELKVGGTHLMLMDLKKPLAAGSQLPLTLHFKDARGVQSRMEISVPVRSTAPAASAGRPNPISPNHTGH